MKLHIIVKLRAPVGIGHRIPHWVDFINDKSAVSESISPDVDALLAAYKLRFWVTREYQPAQEDWTQDELRLGLQRTYRLIFQEDVELPGDLIRRLRSLPAVEDARALSVSRADLPRRELATTASRTRQSAAEVIQLAAARAYSRGAPQITIAVLDTGVNLDHAELAGKVVRRADFVHLDGLNTEEFIGDFTGFDDVPEDEVGHGTHVAGILVGRGLQMDEGVAPECRIMAVRVLATLRNDGHPVGAGIVDNINAGIKWAVDHGADVINMSLGIKHTGGGLPHEDVIRYALGKNVTVVAASGNDGTAERYYPGALPGVIAVGAVDHAGRVTPWTSYGANITVVAPGLNIYSSFARRTYAFASGTSQASPFVAGAVGLMKSYALAHGRTLSNQALMYILKSTSDRVDTRLRNEQAGYGLINLADAFALLNHMLN